MSAVHEKVGMPLDEYLELANEQPFEIINGERIPRMPTVAGHSFLIRLLFNLLSAHLAITKHGECFAESTYILPDSYDSEWVRGSRIPDLLFFAAERWSAYLEANTDWREKPFMLIPDLVIEVISPTDKYSEVFDKVDAYLADGVRLVVLVDSKRRSAVVYAPDAEQPLHLSGDVQIDLGDVIPDFKIALPSLFE